MQEFANFVSLKKISGSSHVKQGVKGGRTPRNAVAGGNGSFVVYERAQIILLLKFKGAYFSKDIYYAIKDCTSKKITDKLCSKLEKGFKDFKFKIRDGEIANLEEAIEYALD